MADYQEHPSKVGGWRAGQMVVYPEARQADCTVWFAFDPNGPSWEGLPATTSGNDIAIVQGVPYFVYDLALGDQVNTATSAEGLLVATTVARRSGMLTFRVVFDRHDVDQCTGLVRDLEPWSCWCDIRSRKFVAVASPPEHAQSVADYLHQREQRSELMYETGQT